MWRQFATRSLHMLTPLQINKCFAAKFERGTTVVVLYTVIVPLIVTLYRLLIGRQPFMLIPCPRFASAAKQFKPLASHSPRLVDPTRPAISASFSSLRFDETVHPSSSGFPPAIEATSTGIETAAGGGSAGCCAPPRRACVVEVNQESNVTLAGMTLNAEQRGRHRHP